MVAAYVRKVSSRAPQQRGVMQMRFSREDDLVVWCLGQEPAVPRSIG
jgi:hypothetical protein